MGPEIIGFLPSQKIHGKIALKAAELDDRTRFLHAIQGLRHLAKRAGIDPANLAYVSKVRRKPRRLMLIKGPRVNLSHSRDRQPVAVVDGGGDALGIYARSAVEPSLLPESDALPTIPGDIPSEVG